MSSNRDEEITGAGESEERSDATDAPHGSGGIIGDNAGVTGAMGGGGGMGGTTGSGLGGREGVVTADVGDNPTSERGGGTGGDITGSIKDSTDDR